MPGGVRSFPGKRVRWRIFALTFAASLMVYVQQKGLTIAGYDMMPGLGLSQTQLGWLESATLLGYAAFQFPGGILGQRLGARATFVAMGLVAFAATVLTPLTPAVLTGSGLFAGLIGLQLLAGLAQAPVFPVGAGVIESWFPARLWALAMGLISMGGRPGGRSDRAARGLAHVSVQMATGPCLDDPAVPPACGALGLVRAQHAGRASGGLPAELDEMAGHEREEPTGLSWSRAWRLLRNRDVLTLTLSYMGMNYVYYLLGNWSFLYFIQQRHFSLLEGGWLAGTPPLAAALGAGLGGQLAGGWARRLGLRWGLHLVPFAALPAAGALLIMALNAANPYLAVAALALSFASIELTEAPFWTAVMHVAGTDTMAASGILNTGGNLGGLVATPIVAYLSGHHQWNAALALGCGCLLLSTLAWVFVDPTRQASADRPKQDQPAQRRQPAKPRSDAVTRRCVPGRATSCLNSFEAQPTRTPDSRPAGGRPGHRDRKARGPRLSFNTDLYTNGWRSAVSASIHQDGK